VTNIRFGKIQGRLFVVRVVLGECLNLRLGVKLVISKSKLICEAGCGLTKL